jgi:hypothetical protein
MSLVYQSLTGLSTLSADDIQVASLSTDELIVNTNSVSINGYQYTFPDVNDTIVTTNATQTLTNKTLTNPIVNSLTTGQLVASDATDHLISVPLTDGQLVIGNTTTGSYSTSTLTAGTSNNFNVTNGHGSVTLDVSLNPIFISATAQELKLQSSTGTNANIYPSSTGNTNFTFPSSGPIQNDLLTTDYLGNTNWTSTPSVAYVTLNDGITGHHVNIRPPTTGNSDFIFPPTNGTANQILQTDGASNSSWTSAPTLSALTVTGNVGIGGTLGVTGQANFDVVTATNITGSGNTSITGNVGIGGTLGATGQANFNVVTATNITGSGNTSITGNVGIGGTLGVTGQANFNVVTATNITGSGNTSITGTLGVGGVISSTNLSLTNAGHSCTLTANSTGTSNFQLPANNGTNGNSLLTDGSGNTSWGTPTPTAVVSPAYEIANGSSSPVSFPYAYAPTANVTVLQTTMSIPAGGYYRINADWNLSITNQAGSTCVYMAYVTDGTDTWAYNSQEIVATSTKQMQCSGISFYTRFTNVTPTISLVFGASGSCRINAQGTVGVLPQLCSYLICTGIPA